jgi:signal transduction histidine kinase
MKIALFDYLTLQKKFIIITFIAVIALMLIIGFTVTRRERSRMYNNIERQGRLLAKTLAIPVMNDLIYEKLGLVEEGGLIDNYITEIFEKKDMDLLYVAVLNEHGKVIAHNNFKEYGKFYRDPLTVKAMKSDSMVVEKFYNSTIGHDALDFATPLAIGQKRWGTLKFAVSLEKLEKEIQELIFGVIILTLLLLLAGFVIIVILSRRFLRPITQLAKTMERAEGDLLDVKVDIKGRDEIALLGQSFNSMIDRIRESNLEMKKTHKKLLKLARTMEKAGGDMLDVKVDIKGKDDVALLAKSFNSMIDRIQESNIELKQTHERLLQSEKLASIGVLVAGVAHEINNPLGGLFNCVKMLEQEGLDEEFRMRYHGLLTDGLNKIETIVGKLLWISRERIKVPVEVEVKQTLKDIYGFIEYKLKKHNILYNENVENGMSVVMDPHDLQQVMINLMINAIQSMKNGGTLGVSAYKSNSKVVIDLADTGEGIDEENIGNIFDPFYTTKQPGEGTGLGLWLTYETLKNYNAEISVQSKKGIGSTFTVRFSGA